MSEKNKMIDCRFCKNRVGCIDKLLFGSKREKCKQYRFDELEYKDLKLIEKMEKLKIGTTIDDTKERKERVEKDRMATAGYVYDCRNERKSYGQKVNEEYMVPTGEDRKAELRAKCTGDGEPKRPRRCKNCKKLLENQVYFCRHCGAYLGD